jgi:hypothetical protein
LSVYLTPKTSVTGNWYEEKKMRNIFQKFILNRIEIAYGTSSGIIRIVVQHPETVGHG